MSVWPVLSLMAVALLVLVVVILGIVGIIQNASRKPDRRFSAVAHQASVLRQSASQGLLTDAECKAQMCELMIAGTDGKWWMVGYKTGAWYAHDGSDWVRAEPPGFKSGAASSRGQ